MTESRSIVVAMAIDDLMLASRVREGLRAFAVDLVPFGSFLEEPGLPRPDCVLVSMAMRRGDPAGTVRTAKARGFLVVAFAGHLETERLELARAAGADKVVANSSVSSHLPEVLRALGVLIEERPRAC